jgi:hypothetical protein
LDTKNLGVEIGSVSGITVAFRRGAGLRTGGGSNGLTHRKWGVPGVLVRVGDLPSLVINKCCPLSTQKECVCVS